MDGVLRGIVIYGVLLLIFRITGKRTLGQTTTFDLVLLLIISETTQQALVGDDYSITRCVTLIATLAGLDLLLSILKVRSKRLDAVLDGKPVVLVEDGTVHGQRLRKERIDREDLLEAARHQHGLESFDEIKHAVLERDGDISIVPRRR